MADYLAAHGWTPERLVAGARHVNARHRAAGQELLAAWLRDASGAGWAFSTAPELPPPHAAEAAYRRLSDGSDRPRRVPKVEAAMSFENHTTVLGNLTASPELHSTSSGVPYATFTLAVSRRRYYKEQQAWGDDFDGYFDVKAWRELGHHAVSSLRKGDRVVVVGHFVQSSWTPDGSSEKRWKTELTAEDVAPSLRWRGWRRGAARVAAAVRTQLPATRTCRPAASWPQRRWTPGIHRARHGHGRHRRADLSTARRRRRGPVTGSP